MRLLTFTNLYPSTDRPRHGIFVEERLRHLVATRRVSARVLALRPSASGFFHDAVRHESRHGIDVEYQAVPTLPVVTNWIDPWLWARACERAVRRLLGKEPTDVVLDAHFLYPDGAAAVLLAARLGVPVVLSARGSDVNVKCANHVMRRWIRHAARNCDALITVSKALADKLAEYGVTAPLVEVLPNGVDLDKFRPLDRAASRATLGLGGPRVVASVGHLVAAKGHALAIEALAELRDTTLLVVGDGPELAALQRLARASGVEQRVRFLGLVAHGRMAEVYSAADALVLPSEREGMPNVVLESLACGTPVVATDVGGIGEVLASPAAGHLLTERSAAALSAALANLFAAPPTTAATRGYAERFAWSGVVDKQLALYRKVLDDRAAARGGR